MPIVDANTAADLSIVRTLFEEYWSEFGFTPCFQGFAEEVAALPGRYVPPSGALGLLYLDNAPAGCVALRRMDDERGEFKRLYVRPAFRGRGAGRLLLDWVVERARQAGYSELVADTMPQMSSALAMYEREGFERTVAYAAEATPGAIYLRRRL